MNSRNLGIALSVGLVGALAGIALLLVFVLPGGSPSGSRNNASAENPPAAQKTQTSNGQSADTREVSKERAGEIAVAHLGDGRGRVTGIGRENDHEALWEVEVTRPDDAEADVFVAANGEVTHVNEKGRQGGRGAQQPQQPQQQQAAPEPVPEPAPERTQTIDAQQAGEIAASHVGGTVDTVNREPDGDYGAAWDVDVYSPDGEYTIYVSAAGEVVRVEGPFTG